MMEAYNNAGNPVPSLDATQRIQELWLKTRHEITEIEAENNIGPKMLWMDFMHGLVHTPGEEPISFYKLFMEIFDITKIEFKDEAAGSQNRQLIESIKAWRNDVKAHNTIAPGIKHLVLIENGIEYFDRYEAALLNKGLICVLRKKK
jgi:hypothetical protein